MDIETPKKLDNVTTFINGSVNYAVQYRGNVQSMDMNQ